MKTLNLLFLVILLPFTLELQAQEGYSSASVSSQRNARNHNIPQPEDIVVEEYMNFRSHAIDLPSGKHNVALDLRWASQTLERLQDEAVLQVGIATEKITDFSKIPPMNISLVIDNSGSMQSYDKIQKVKEALLVFIEKLRPDDVVSVIAFNSSARVVIPAQKVKNIKMLRRTIESIHAGGGTNINDGLVKGYRELLSKYDKNITNRVLLLTDGQANVGEVNAEAITSNPTQQNIVRNVNLSAIGVGVEYNSDLLRQLVNSAGGQLHFIANEEDISKVFIQEVESLLFPIAKDAQLEIEYDKDLEIDQFFGYQPSFVGNKIIIELENFNAGLTQVLLSRFKLKSRANTRELQVKVRLVYEDLQKQKQVVQESKINLEYAPKNDPKLLLANINHQQNYILTYHKKRKEAFGSLLLDQEVKKNYVIAYLAQALKEIAKTYHSSNTKQAKHICDFTLEEIRKAGNISEDKDVKIVFEVLEKYQKILGNS